MNTYTQLNNFYSNQSNIQGVIQSSNKSPSYTEQSSFWKVAVFWEWSSSVLRWHWLLSREHGSTTGSGCRPKKDYTKDQKLPTQPVSLFTPPLNYEGKVRTDSTWQQYHGQDLLKPGLGTPDLGFQFSDFFSRD